MILTFAGHFGYYVNRRENMAKQDFKQWSGFWHEWKTEATSGIAESCDSFWDIVYDCRRWFTLCWFWKCYQTVHPMASLYTHCVPALTVLLWFSSCEPVAERVGSVLSLLLASILCETVPLASLVHEITALKFKLQVAVYLNRNYPQHLLYETLGSVLWNLPFGWRNTLHTEGFLCV